MATSARINGIPKKMLRDNRVYIVPSLGGLIYLGVTIVFILMAAVYNNEALFALSFFLAAVFLVSMWQTNSNLSGVHLDYLSAEEGFEDQFLSFTFQMRHDRGSAKPAIHLRVSSKIFTTTEHGLANLPAHAKDQRIQLSISAKKRGVHPLPTMVVETFYPFGIFRAWKVFHPKGNVVVYPKPAGERVLAEATMDAFSETMEGAGQRVDHGDHGDFGELKNYRPGESYNHIAWKQFARTGQMYSKVYWSGEKKFYSLPWDPQGASTESYLRQMSRWVQIALQQGAYFEMQLPKRKLEAGFGPDQAAACLRALAEVGKAS